jgi:transcriptional regulator with XRE-family HTH domain
MSSPRICIKEIAEQKGFDAAKLARKADMSYSTVWSLWNNPHRMNVPLKTLVRIADVLGVEVNDLLKNDAAPPLSTDGTHPDTPTQHNTEQDTPG